MRRFKKLRALVEDCHGTLAIVFGGPALVGAALILWYAEEKSGESRLNYWRTSLGIFFISVARAGTPILSSSTNGRCFILCGMRFAKYALPDVAVRCLPELDGSVLRLSQCVIITGEVWRLSSNSMRILSWNINGIRTLPHYHPWSQLKTCDAILPELQAEIICFQEMKISRKDLDQKTAVPDSYDSFFSFPKLKGGYSGVSVYVKSQEAVPYKAEEGLSGTIQPKPAFVPEERISASYPRSMDLPLLGDETGDPPNDLNALDAEGRAIVVDFGLFVLINTYCPNDASDTRLVYKMNFHMMLEERVRILIAEGREVIVVGDINVVADLIDHGEGTLESRKHGFHDSPQRAWFRKWLAPRGPMHDVIRASWPDRKGMYTCWNTKISARDSNYGTRIDYILVTAGLLPWIKGGDIQASVRGSDHCPVYIDLHDEITLPSGQTRTLRSMLGLHSDENPAPGIQCSRLAARFWPEFSGKQKLLSSFFGKGAMPTNSSLPPYSSLSGDVDENLPIGLVHKPAATSIVTPVPSPALAKPQHAAVELEDDPEVQASRTLSSTLTKRKSPTNEGSYNSSKSTPNKRKSGQRKLSSFFSHSESLGASTSTTTTKANDSNSSTIKRSASALSAVQVNTGEIIISEIDESAHVSLSPNNSSKQLEDDYAFALSLAEDPQEPSASQSSQQSNGSQKDAWSKLTAPLITPRCSVHSEPAKQFRVNKPGPNKGKLFYVCSRPVGPGYDAGRSIRLRSEVDPQWKCDFFKWASDVRREQNVKSS